MPDYDPEGFGRRIIEAMESARIPDIKTLQERLKNTVPTRVPPVRGTSYTAVFQYAKGQWPTEPNREVIEGLATVLGVFPDHLLFGGPRNELEAQAEAAIAAGEESSTAEFRERMHERVPFLRYMDADRSIEAHFLRVSMGFTAANRRLGLSESKGGYEEWEAACDFINEHITAPLDYWYDQHGRNVRMEGETFALYVEAALHALRLSLQAEISPESETEGDNGEES
jgi:hypothetical protein